MSNLEQSSVLAVAVSPLPNLLAKVTPGVELVHKVSFSPVAPSRLSGEATIRLAADRSRLGVSVHSAGVHPGQLQLVRVATDPPAAGGLDEKSGELLMLVLRPSRSLRAECDPFTKQFTVSDGCDSIPSQALGNVRSILSGASNLIDGITLSPARDGRKQARSHLGAGAAPTVSVERRRAYGSANEDEYLRRRMLTEIKAALRAQRPGIASVHIGLATLYAARISSEAAAMEHRPS